jgi:uncharacterized membrane protein YkoI
MKKQNRTPSRPVFAAVVAAGSLVALSAPALAYTGQQFENQAKVSLKQAEAIAAKASRGGTITARELEKEHGGSGLRYSFDVKTNGKTREIGVDAMTGKLLENSLEGPDAD